MQRVESASSLRRDQGRPLRRLALEHLARSKFARRRRLAPLRFAPLHAQPLALIVPQQAVPPVAWAVATVQSAAQFLASPGARTIKRSFAAVSASSSTPSVSRMRTVHWRANEKEPFSFEALIRARADGRLGARVSLPPSKKRRFQPVNR